MSAAVRFSRQLLTALPGGGYREWFYYPDEKRVDSWPILGWAVYHEKAAAHECDEDSPCECEGDDSAIVVALSASGDGDVEELTDDHPSRIGVLPAGQGFTTEEASEIFLRKQKEQDDRFARARALKAPRT